jgi:hypothetical protein
MSETEVLKKGKIRLHTGTGTNRKTLIVAWKGSESRESSAQSWEFGPTCTLDSVISRRMRSLNRNDALALDKT